MIDHRTTYNPASLDKEKLISDFAVRKKPFRDILQDFIHSKMIHPEQHYLLIGGRGSGKTNLILRLFYAVEDEENLKACIPVLIGEDSYHISELSNVWEHVGKSLQHLPGFEGLEKDLRPEFTANIREERIFKILVNTVKSQRRKIILFIDDFSSLLNKLDDIEIKRLREVLMTCPEIRLVASSPVLPGEVSAYQRPLYDFFKIVVLDGLSSSEAMTLFEHITGNRGEIPSSFEAIRRLCLGNVKFLTEFSHIFLNNKGSDPVSILIRIMDAYTPAYRLQMKTLSKYQQKIVDAVAMNFDAISTKEISDRTGIESKAVSSQLGQMVKNGIIVRVMTGTKNLLYRLHDRLFNLWYLSSAGSSSSSAQVKWLVSFMVTWCNRMDPFSTGSHPVTAGNNAKLDSALKLLRQDKIDEGLELVKIGLSSSSYIHKNLDLVIEFFLLLIAKEQRYTTYKLFIEDHPGLKAMLKPIYFALMKQMKEEHPFEFLKAGPELEETIDEITTAIKEKI